MILDGYDIGGVKLGFDFDEGPVQSWINGADLMKYIKNARNITKNISGTYVVE